MDCGGKRSATPLLLAELGFGPAVCLGLSHSGVALRLPPQSISA